jgi:hypothetical protein
MRKITNENEYEFELARISLFGFGAKNLTSFKECTIAFLFAF